MVVDNSDFGKWLKQRRRMLDLTQGELAQRISCATDTVKKIESGILRPSKQLSELMAVFLGVPAEERDKFTAFARGMGEVSPALLKMMIPEHQAFSTQVPYSVPTPLTSLVGRENDLRVSRELLQQPETHLLTLHGPPGVGKTRLSLELSRQLQAEYTHGACFVPLAPVSDPLMVLPAIAKALMLREVSGQALLNTVQASLRDKQLLLVLDNFEQVVDAAPVLTDLLMAAPGVKALVSSRELLRLYGETAFPVPPLGIPVVRANLLPTHDALVRYPAVQLFVQRALAVKPDFELNVGNAGLVAQICECLDGLPLAIEMAAAQVRWITLPDLLNQLRHQLVDLSSQARGVSSRQQTLRGAIDWSFNLLAVHERQLFTCASVFSGGWSVDAALAVVREAHAAPELLAEMRVLADKSLMRVDAGLHGEPRFAMLETIRDYAGEKLRLMGGEYETRHKHAVWCLSLALQAEPELRGPRQETWLARLEIEVNNLRAALDWCLEHEVQLGLQLAVSSWQFWYARGYISEGAMRLQQLLARADESIPPDLRGWALRGVSALLHHQGLPEQAEKLATQALQVFQQIDDANGIAAAMHQLGNVALMQSNYEKATALYTEALRLYRESGNIGSSAAIIMNLGLIAKDHGEYSRAIVLYEESIALHRQLGNMGGIAHALTHQSIAAYWIGNYAKAVAVAEQALVTFKEGGTSVNKAYALETLGMALYKQHQLPRATTLVRESLSIMREIGDRSGSALLLTDLGMLLTAQGDYTEAARLHRQALQVALEVGDRRRIAFCLEGLAQAMAAEQSLRAAHLIGAASQLREDIAAPLPPSERADYDDVLAQLRERIGSTAVNRALADGRAMTLEQTLALAFDS
jgi:predicted ATPase/DNA-binding XRE family transcriptional regulator